RSEGERQACRLSIDSSQRRRSPRLSSPQAQSDNKMALPSLAVKRSITVRKIAPRKTVALSEQNKENTPKPSSSSSAKKKKATMPSPILPSSPPPASHPPQMDPEDAVWSQKVRRSYSRLSEKSFNSPDLSQRDRQDNLESPVLGLQREYAIFTQPTESKKVKPGYICCEATLLTTVLPTTPTHQPTVKTLMILSKM
uniref:Uncharacterized protein n=1 Tax=Neolamprologus brichardi TaxID=32507 RepID=A0A3Q4HC72_NEOBR